MKVTIGLPVYNSEKYISNTIISILNQSSKDWICIIIDDGSTDNSVEVIEKLIKGDSRFKLIADGKNLGLSSRLNQISSLSQTPYLARMDADDIMTDNRILIQLDFLKNSRSVDVVGSSAYIIDTANEICGFRKGQTRFDTWNALRQSLFIHPTVMGRTQWFKENPYSNKIRRSEDYELWSRTVHFSNFSYINEPLLFYREVGLKHGNKYESTMIEILKFLREHRLGDDAVFGPYISDLIRSGTYRKKVFKLVSNLGMEKYLLQRRSAKLDEAEKHKAVLALQKVLSPKLPIPIESMFFKESE